MRPIGSSCSLRVAYRAESEGEPTRGTERERGEKVGLESAGEGLIRTGNSLIGCGWAITKGFFALVLWGAIIGGCIAAFS